MNFLGLLNKRREWSKFVNGGGWENKIKFMRWGNLCEEECSYFVYFTYVVFI